jgi:GT2 family glycosyltransferase
MSVSAILVSFNSSRVLPDAIRSVVLQPEITKIIMVDNASTDDSCELVGRLFPQVEIIRSDENLGFGRANNIALKIVATPYALLINPDASLNDGSIRSLIEVMQANPECAIAAPVLYDSKGNPLESYKRNVFDREKHKYPYTPPDGNLCADFLSGAVWLMRIEHMKSFGLFNPDLFLYYEDDDLCMSARKCGFSLILCTQARAQHNMGTSSETVGDIRALKQHHLMLSRLIIEEKYHGIIAAKKLAARWKLQ